MDLQDITLDIEQHIDIKAPILDVFDGMLARLGERNMTPGDHPMPMRLERWPGGRWFRELGEDVGHLWGFVQVIKPPTLLEITGPMFMSYPVAGHLALRLSDADGGTTRLALRHRVLGIVEDDHRKGAASGWEYFLQNVKRDSE